MGQALELGAAPNVWGMKGQQRWRESIMKLLQMQQLRYNDCCSSPRVIMDGWAMNRLSKYLNKYLIESNENVVNNI